MKLRIFFSVMLLTLFASQAKAWNCNNPLDARVDVGKTKPSGSAGDGDNQYFLGTGTEGVKGDYYVCKPPIDPTAPSNTLKQKQKQQQQQNQTANGGNSTNTNQNTASSVLTNSGNSASTSSATNNGNGANNSTYNSETNVEASKIPVNTAIGIAPPSTLNCTTGIGVGGQTAPVGLSLGFSKVNKNCEQLTTALTARNRLTYCKIWIRTKWAKEADITLQDCLDEPQAKVEVVQPVPVPTPTTVVVPAPNVTVVLPAPVSEPKPVITAEQEQSSYLGKCTIDRINTCKAFIEKAIQSHAFGLRVVGPREGSFVSQFLRERHSGMRLEQRLSDDQNSTVTLFLLFPPESVSLGQ